MGKFNVLWIDDQPEKCIREQELLKRAILMNGLEDNIEFIKKVRRDQLLIDGHESNKRLRSRDYDLLIIDHNLSGDLLGGDVISEVRRKYNIYTDIIFYSSMKNELIASVKKSFDNPSSLAYLDNINIVPLGDDFSTKIQSIINKIVESWYNAHSIRGVILAKTSKFENMVSLIIRKYYKFYIEQLRDVLKTKGENVKRAQVGKWNCINVTKDPVEYVLADPINFNWSVKKVIFDFLIDNKAIEIGDETRKTMATLFQLRNDFAHNEVKIENGVCTLFKNGEAIAYDTTKIRLIREQITQIEDSLKACY